MLHLVPVCTFGVSGCKEVEMIMSGSQGDAFFSEKSGCTMLIMVEGNEGFVSHTNALETCSRNQILSHFLDAKLKTIVSGYSLHFCAIGCCQFCLQMCI